MHIYCPGNILQESMDVPHGRIPPGWFRESPPRACGAPECMKRTGGQRVGIGVAIGIGVGTGLDIDSDPDSDADPDGWWMWTLVPEEADVA